VPIRLSDLKEQERGVITRIEGSGAFKTRISEMGFVKGQEVAVVKNAPLRDPIEYNIMGYDVSLRRREAENIFVVPTEDAEVLVKEVSSTIGASFEKEISDLKVWIDQKPIEYMIKMGKINPLNLQRN
jgi:ferrous iron transport protein B